MASQTGGTGLTEMRWRTGRFQRRNTIGIAPAISAAQMWDRAQYVYPWFQ